MMDTRIKISKIIHQSRQTECIKAAEKPKANEFEINDIVYRQRNPHEKEHKMSFKYEGPYRIIGKTQFKSYKIIGFDGITRTVNRRKLISTKNVMFDCEEGGLWQPVSDKLTVYSPLNQL